MRPFRYNSGDIVHVGDTIEYSGMEGVVAMIFDGDQVEPKDHPEAEWLVGQFGSGVIIEGPVLGSLLLQEIDNEEDLVLIEAKGVIE